MQKLNANNKPFFIRDLSIHRFWCSWGGGSWNQSPLILWDDCMTLVLCAIMNVHTFCSIALCPLGVLALNLFISGPGNLGVIMRTTSRQISASELARFFQKMAILSLKSKNFLPMISFFFFNFILFLNFT